MTLRNKFLKFWIVLLAALIIIMPGIPTTASASADPWEPVGSPGFSAEHAWHTSLYVYNGMPYVAYQNLGNGCLLSDNFDEDYKRLKKSRYTYSNRATPYGC